MQEIFGKIHGPSQTTFRQAQLRELKVCRDDLALRLAYLLLCQVIRKNSGHDLPADSTLEFVQLLALPFKEFSPDLNLFPEGLSMNLHKLLDSLEVGLIRGLSSEKPAEGTMDDFPSVVDPPAPMTSIVGVSSATSVSPAAH